MITLAQKYNFIRMGEEEYYYLFMGWHYFIHFSMGFELSICTTNLDCHTHIHTTAPTPTGYISRRNGNDNIQKYAHHLKTNHIKCLRIMLDAFLNLLVYWQGNLALSIL
jgi:hypothetical protein